MRMHLRIVDILFGCWHRRLSFPFTSREEQPSSAAARQTGTYIVCLSCGKQFPYDWQQMRILGPSEQADAYSTCVGSWQQSLKRGTIFSFARRVCSPLSLLTSFLYSLLLRFRANPFEAFHVGPLIRPLGSARISFSLLVKSITQPSRFRLKIPAGSSSLSEGCSPASPSSAAVGTGARLRAVGFSLKCQQPDPDV